MITSTVGPPDISGGTFFWNALLFVRALRTAGIRTDIGGAILYARALANVDIGDREQVRACGMAVFVNGRDEIPLYDDVFARFWDHHELSVLPPGLMLPELEGGPHEGVEEHTLESQTEADDEAVPDERSLAATSPAPEDDAAAADDVETADERAWTMLERLRHKPFERMTESELRDAERLVDRLRPRFEQRTTRRRELHRRGPDLATRQTFRRNVPHGGDLVEWVWQRPARRPRSIVVLCDISGSMERHSRLLMRFAMALRSVSNVRTEAFVFGTHLTRLTHELAGRQPDAALREASEIVSDWSGGTRIGESLRAFNQRWSRRVLRSSGIVIIVSDGWDRGDPELVRSEMARLQRSCHRLIWLNPLAGEATYEPLAAGMAAAYASIDDFVPARDLASLERLSELLAEMADHRSRRPDRTGRPRVHAREQLPRGGRSMDAAA